MEVWRPIPGLGDRFEASSEGRIRRARHTGRGGKPAGTLVKLAGDASGYLKFVTSVDGQAVTYWAHQLVASAFHGPCPAGLEVAYADGVKRNIRPDNLSYKTHAENIAQKEEHGSLLRGSAVGNAKLTEADVRAIRASREGPTVLAARYGVHYRHIWRVRTGQRWQHLGDAA